MNLERMKFDFKQELDSDTLVIRLYGEVKPDSENWFTGEVTKSKTSQEYFAEELDKHKNVRNIELYINSCGGYVEQGYGIYANLKRHPAKKTCYVDGFANSIASIIAMACDRIVMYVNSTMGIHNISAPCYGNAFEHRQCAEYLDKLMEGNREIYLQRSGGKITLDKLTELLDQETCLTAKECLEYGFCDEIEETKAGDITKQNEAVEQSLQAMAQSLKTMRELRQAARMVIEDSGQDAEINRHCDFDLSACMEKAIVSKSFIG